MTPSRKAPTTWQFMADLGVEELPALTVPFDPGYDPATTEAHLEQSAHLMAMLKLSMACWIVADEKATKRKMAAAAANGVKVVSGGGPFEISAANGRLPEFMDLCAGLGFSRIEAGEGFTDLQYTPTQILAMANERGLEVQAELGGKHDGPFDEAATAAQIARGREWLDAGAVEIVVEARESASGVGLFATDGTLDVAFADRFADSFGLDHVVFEAPVKASQFAMLNHFGPRVRLGNVRLEELLRVEIYRRGLHSDAFGQPGLRPHPRAARK